MLKHCIIKAILLVLLVSVRFESSFCICRQTYHTICDTIKDYEKFNDGTWTDVLIKSPPGNIVTKVPFRVANFRKLNSLTIIDQIEGLGDGEPCPYEVKLISLNFYENSIEAIKEGNFVRFLKLRKLGLANNGIRTIHRGAFLRPQIEVIDLSNNHIEKIPNGTFTIDQTLREIATTTIILSNNKLSDVETYSFPHSLKILKLDHNNLTVLPDGVLGPNLQALYLSHNQLTSLPNIADLNELTVLDISHNDIFWINSGAFGNSKKLKIFDLSHNKLTTVSFLKPLLLKDEFNSFLNEDLEISLNFNKLTDFVLDVDTNLTHKILNLYGNPWMCKTWRSVQDILDKINVKRSKCDLEFFKAAPFCTVSYLKPLENYVQEYYDAVVEEEDFLSCHSSSKSYGNLFYQRNTFIRCN